MRSRESERALPSEFSGEVSDEYPYAFDGIDRAAVFSHDPWSLTVE